MYPAPPPPHPGSGENSVTVRASDFEEGRLPAICVVTGSPATSNLPRRFTTTPRWVGCLLFISFLALIVAAAATRRSAFGFLPVCSAVAVRVLRWRAVAVRLFLVGIVLALAVIAVSFIPAAAPIANVLLSVLAGLAFLALIGSAVASGIERATLGIQGRVAEDGFGTRWVQLRGVHPAFSRALEALGR